MEKALVIYNKESGRGNFEKKLEYIKKELASTFKEMLFLTPSSKNEAKEIYLKEASKYDALIVIGGDGTFNFAINNLMTLSKKPVLGYINSGTLGDVGKNFGINRNLKRSLKIIKEGNIKQIDIGKISNKMEEMYFTYTLCIGAYSSIPYTVKNKKKRHMYEYSYYFASMKEMFKRQNIDATYSVKGISNHVKTPFILIMNGKYMAGFELNKEGKIGDSLMECYFPKQSTFNGITRFLPFKKERPIITNEMSVSLDNKELYWCVDGEKGLKGDVKIELLPASISVFSM